jgi:hypothetical protein
MLTRRCLFSLFTLGLGRAAPTRASGGFHTSKTYIAPLLPFEVDKTDFNTETYKLFLLRFMLVRIDVSPGYAIVDASRLMPRFWATAWSLGLGVRFLRHNTCACRLFQNPIEQYLQETKEFQRAIRRIATNAPKALKQRILLRGTGCPKLTLVTSS